MNNPNTWGFENYGTPPRPDNLHEITFDIFGFVKDRIHWGGWNPEIKVWSITSLDGNVWSWNYENNEWEINNFLYSNEWFLLFPKSHYMTFQEQLKFYS